MQSSPILDSRALADSIQHIDDQLSKRPLDLDPAGYFIIYVDHANQLIGAKHFSTVINEQGLATDPETGLVIPARGQTHRQSQTQFTGRTAKELCVQLFEQGESVWVSQLSHAAYLGREFQKAEAALIQGTEYSQD